MDDGPKEEFLTASIPAVMKEASWNYHYESKFLYRIL